MHLRLKNKYFKIFHQNIRFAAGKKLSLEHLLLTEILPSVVCLTELALFEEEVPHFCLNGYTLVSSFCRLHSNRGGGVGLFISDNLLSKSKPVCIKQLCVTRKFEACAMEVRLDDIILVILCIYRSPSDIIVDVDRFIDSLIDTVDFLLKDSMNKKIVLIGDMNICTLKESYKRSRLFECITMFDLHSALSMPTRTSQNSQSAIDCIFTNMARELYKTEVIETGLSDHCGVSIDLTINKQVKESLCNHRFLINEESVRAFQYFLSELDWTDVMRSSCGASGFTLFHNKLTTLFRLCFQIKTFKNKNKPKIFTNSQLQALKTKIIFLSNKNNDSSYNNTRSELLAKYKLKYNEELKKEKKKQFQQQINNSDNLIKSTWPWVN